MRTFQYFVDNTWRDPASGQYFDSENPADGKVWARVPDCNAEDIDHAVSAARAAYYDGPWGNMHPAERGRMLRRIGDTISRHADRLGEIETRDNGKLPKNITPSLKADAWQVDSFHYYAGMCDKFEGRLIPAEVPDMHNYLKWEPFGVVAQILQEFDIKHVTGSTYHPQSQAMVERMHQTLNRVVRGLVQDHPEDWQSKIPYAQFLLRTTPLKVLGSRSPYEVITGIKPGMPAVMRRYTDSASGLPL